MRDAPQTPSTATRAKLTRAGWTADDVAGINWHHPTTGHVHSWPVALHLMQPHAPTTPGDAVTPGPGKNWRKGYRKDVIQLVPPKSQKKPRKTVSRHSRQ